MKKIYVGFTLLLLAIILVGCKSKQSDDDGISLNKFKNSDIVYDGASITWTKVAKIEQYTFLINGADEELLTTNSRPYKTDEDQFEVTLRMKYKKKESEFKRTFKKLDDVTNIKFDNTNQLIEWDHVVNADKYSVQLNGTEIKDNKLNNYKNDQTGSFKIRVKAVGLDTEGEAYYSYYNEIFEYRKLESPTNVVYNNNEELITWNGVLNATSYSIYINGEALEGFQNVNGTSVHYQALGKDFNVSVVANGSDENTYSSESSESSKYIFLDSVENLRLEEGILYWNEVKNATAYELLINDRKVVVKDTKYTDFDSGISYRFQIKALTDKANHFSHYTDPKTINILRTPVIKYDQGIITWNQISNASGYTAYVYFGGKLESTTSIDGGVSQFEYNFPQVGVYEVYLKANKDSNNASMFDSRLSKSIKFTRLDAPAQYKIHNNFNDNSEAVIELTNVPGSNGYDVKADKVTISRLGNDNLFFTVGPNRDADNREGIVIKVDVKTLGKKINDNEYTLDSINEKSFEIQKLATPTSRISANKLMWTPVKDAKGYLIDIDGNSEYVSSNVIEKVFSQSLSAGEHNIMIRAISDANSKNIISSDYDNAHKVFKLSVPSNVVIYNEILRWSEVAQSLNYEVRYGTQDVIVKTSINEFGELRDIVSTTAQTIQVRALGDNANILDSDYSQNQTFRKLDSPTGLKATNSNIIFNYVSGSDGYVIIINGESNRVTSTSVPHKNLFNVAGTYNMSVKAKGDDGNTLDSDPSDIVSVVKLEELNAVPSEDNTSLTWKHTALAKSYSIRVNQDPVVLTEKNEFKPNIKSAGTNRIELISIGNDNNVISSEPVLLNIVAKTLAKPVITATVSARNVTVSVTNLSSYHASTRWNYIAGGNVQSDKESSQFTYEDVQNGSIDYRVVAKGSYFDCESDNLTFYVDSIQSDAKKVTFLNDVNMSTLTFDGGKFEWRNTNPSISNLKYRVTIEFLDKEGNKTSEDVVKEVLGHLLIAEKPANTVKTTIKITALGDGITTFDSNEVVKVFQ